MNNKPKIISRTFIEAVCARLAANQRVRRSLPEWGRLHIDRQLPFLCVYRSTRHDDQSMSQRLIMGEAAYLIAPGVRRQHEGLSLLAGGIARTLRQSFGSFLIVEVWVAFEAGRNGEGESDRPSFRIFQAKNNAIGSTVAALEKNLKKILIGNERAAVEIVDAAKITPPGLQPLLSAAESKRIGCHVIGIEVSPIYLNQMTDQVYPLIRRKLQRGFNRALKHGFFKFTHDHTTHRPPHFHSLGRRSMVKAVWEADRQLADICDGFDFLLHVTPANSHQAWGFFKRNHFERVPEFIYRPLAIDPILAKRRLFQVPVDRIEDPTLAQLFRDQQLALDRMFTLLLDLGTPRFLFGSLQLYGTLEDSLVELADGLLSQIPPRSRDEPSAGAVDADAFAERARRELAYFRSSFPEVSSKVVVRDDITGLMVSRGDLLIGKHTKIPISRVEALIQHEVGTHVLTYLNGRSQPLRQLYVGLAGYEKLQEGLAVFSEYLVGGLTRKRFRLLAARVAAVRHLIDGASFIEVFRILNKSHGFERRNAFIITMRTFRGGGLTKDAIYLQGLVELLDYLERGGSLEQLLVGKISAAHVAIIKELQWRNVLHPAPLRPRYLDEARTADRLKNVRNGLDPMSLIERSQS